jgi:hypothetical protein
MRSRLAFLATAVGLSVAVTTPVFSQAVGPKRVPVPPMAFGILGGVNIFTFSGSDATGAKSRTSFFAGASLNLPLSSSVFVQPEALYSGEGGKFESAGTTDELKLAYLRVPLLLGVDLTPSARTGLRIFAGPVAGFKVSCDAAETTGGTTTSASCSSIPGLDLKSTDFGVTGGAGLTFHMPRFNINVEGRYTLGLAKIVSSLDVKNQGFSIGAGLSFPLARK